MFFIVFIFLDVSSVFVRKFCVFVFFFNSFDPFLVNGLFWFSF
jgi:hypothetical protein